MAAKRLPSAPAQPQQEESPPKPPESLPNGNGSPPAITTGTAPVWKKRFFSSGSFVEVAVFRHPGETRPQGQSHPSFSIALDRSYKDQEGKWTGTNSLRRDDLLVAAHALQRAYAWISEHEQQQANGTAVS